MHTQEATPSIAPMPPFPLVSFVIPALNEERWIAPCIRSIIDSKDPCVHEIIVVDNGSTDRTAEIASSFAGVKVIREERKGISRARQRGLEACTGDLYAALDADTRIGPNWMRVMKDRFERDDVACVIGPYRYYDLAAYKRWIRDAIMFALSAGRAMVGLPPSYACGGNTVYRAKALRAAGGFNVDIPFYGEDVDTLIRIKPFGKIVHDRRMYALSSARRINAEGFWKVIFAYKANAMWQKITNKPLLRRVQKDWR